MSRQRRFGIWLAVLGAIAGASIGYALEGVGLAIAEALAFLFAGVVAFRYVPEVLPPPPGSVVRPPIGQSPTAVRRRRTEGFAVLVAGVPMVVASASCPSGCRQARDDSPRLSSRPSRRSGWALRWL
jgi:hypothetical protein